MAKRRVSTRSTAVPNGLSEDEMIKVTHAVRFDLNMSDRSSTNDSEESSSKESESEESESENEENIENNNRKSKK